MGKVSLDGLTWVGLQLEQICSKTNPGLLFQMFYQLLEGLTTSSPSHDPPEGAHGVIMSVFIHQPGLPGCWQNQKTWQSR